MFLRCLTRLKGSVHINGIKYAIPYEGATILTVYETNSLAIKSDCRKGICKSCLVSVSFDGQDPVETVACMEPAENDMEISSIGSQVIDIPLPHAESKRVTTRKIAKVPPSSAQKAASIAAKILRQAQEAALDGDWEGCAEFGDELLEISNRFSSQEDRNQVFLVGPSRDSLRDFIACLKSSGNKKCENIAKLLNNIRA